MPFARIRLSKGKEIQVFFQVSNLRDPFFIVCHFNCRDRPFTNFHTSKLHTRVNQSCIASRIYYFCFNLNINFYSKCSFCFCCSLCFISCKVRMLSLVSESSRQFMHDLFEDDAVHVLKRISYAVS